MTAAELLETLRSHANAANVAGMARYGIQTEFALGVPVPVIRSLAKQAGKNHALARDLWNSGIHEARILATLVEELDRVTPRQMDGWARQFDSWDVCDHACHNLFRYAPCAWEKAAQWGRARPEFVKRAGFSLMAGLAVKDKAAADSQFEALFPLIEEAAGDGRNMVKKAVNWALRQIGKRNPRLRRKAIAAARRIHKQGTVSARWIAGDALREFSRLGLKESRGTGNLTMEANTP
jgi:3-methyladenine DNA glycosylase AlkD